MIYYVVLVSGVQQNHSATYIHLSILFQIRLFLDNVLLLLLFFFAIFRATPAAYGGSQTRGPMEL